MGDPAATGWLAVNQFTVVEEQHQSRPGLVMFHNGLPLAVIEQAETLVAGWASP